ncbi:hypothetical protein GEV33_002576 [Tenebrio molitor]|uniref:Uncharacterized protein n=1 Tax=Tenebrio molitor TaxID=7067 RepID=A0A8J6HT23_TENMO|nr:hypothetical protein GEV33_002576 [Tenebrio molitor]
MTGVTLVDGIGLIANVLCSLSCEDGKEMLKDTDLFPEEISSLPDLGKRIGQGVIDKNSAGVGVDKMPKSTKPI